MVAAAPLGSAREATMNVVELFTSFKGRVGRATFGCATLALFILSLLIFAVIGFPMKLADYDWPHIILSLAFVWPHWALSTKRAHDLDKSGWWLLGWVAASWGAIILMLLAAVLTFQLGVATGLTLLGLAWLLSLASFYQVCIKLLFFRGTAGGNSFGPPPRLLQTLLNDEDWPDAPMAAPQMQPPLGRTPAVAAKLSAAPAKTPATRPVAAKPSGFGRRNTMRPA
jgi:uncharacterized membrane protein YhaH (DUF805 family)